MENGSSYNYGFAYVYAKGYYAGRAHGCSENPYPDDEGLTELYNAGYEKGVADYCEFDEAKSAS